MRRTRESWVCTEASASTSPAAKLASYAQSTEALVIAPLAMLQYPAGALCTELWKRVGEICRSSVASCWQISWQFCPSLAEDENTVTRSCAATAAAAAASNPA